MARNAKADREARLARERLKVFTAKQTVHDHGIKRRKRDNAVAIVAVVAVAVLAGLSQASYFGIGPGATEPTPIATATDEPTSQPTPSNENTDEPAGHSTGAVPDPSLAENRVWQGSITLNDIELSVSLDGTVAPQAVASFIAGVEDEYFVGKTCHRLTDGFARLIQCGSLDGTGTGDPDFMFGPIENAPEDEIYEAGTIAMARQGQNAFSNGRQFFIMLEDGQIQSDSAGGYTVFGTVTEGLERLIADIADKGIRDGASDGPPVVDTVITGVTIR